MKSIHKGLNESSASIFCSILPSWLHFGTGAFNKVLLSKYEFDENLRCQNRTFLWDVNEFISILFTVIALLENRYIWA